MATGTKILVVDDDHNFKRLLETFLELRGAKVYLAQRVVEAIQILKTVSIDLILSDLHMPGINGRLLPVLAGSNAVDTPVIIVTADRKFTVEEARASGAHGVLYKPVIWSELTEIIDRFATRPH